MNHLLAQLLQHDDPRVLGLVLLEALLGSGTAMRILLWRRSGRPRTALIVMTFGLVISLSSWLAFRTALAGSYPQLRLAVPADWAFPALAISMLSSVAAGAIQRRCRRSARSAMLAGSLLACGFSCMLFTGMAGLVRPFALAYDLTAVLITMVLGAALSGFALWECSNPVRRHAWVFGTGLIALATIGLAFGSVAAILPFEGWMNAATRPDDLASSPIAIILAAEAVAVLVFSLFGSLVDNRVAARDQLEADRLRQLADSTLEGILIHRDGEILDANDSVTVLLGVTLPQLRGSRVSRFMVPGGEASLWIAEPGATPTETEILMADGCRLPVEILSRSISYGGQTAVVTALRDVRERRESEARIRFLAHHDMLTELPNRVMLNESLELALRLSTRTQAPLAVFCLDLDGFKLVNDTLGHAAGDQLLCQVAVRLRNNLRDTDLVARVGGDEFVVLQTTGAQPEQACLLAQRIVDCMAHSFRIDEQDVNVGASIGIAVYPQDGETASLLLKKADVALYRAKKSGRGWFCLFENGMDAALRERRDMEKGLRAALLRNELTLSFQPLFDSDRELIAFEALARWTHPTLGPISPEHFIPLAEECGLMIPLGEWVLRTACTAAMSWDSECRVAVNLSPVQFRVGNLSVLIAAILQETGLPPSRLELEITEGVLIENADSAFHLMHALRELGIRLVLDDFGTGYSSLSYLHRFPFDKLKVDRSFVQRLESDVSSRAIVNAIISMSRSLNLEVTAEGVETIEQFDLLCAQGCHELQGFLLGRPMPQDAVGRFLQDRAGRKAATLDDALVVSA